MSALNIKLFIATAFLGLSCALSAQNDNGLSGKLLQRAELLRKNYIFEEAGQLYNKVLENTSDSSARPDILSKIIECQNGANLLQYIVRPTTIATGDFPSQRFFLHIGELPQGAWKPIPNPFVKQTNGKAHRFCHAIYFPDNSSRIIFSAPDEKGSWNIYTSVLKDTIWSLPQLLSKNIVSDKDEIYPMLSSDGKTLFFASNGMAGMGGYDIFYSRWNERMKEWSIPENLGFPYSSTADDIFYLDTENGMYSIVVSNRETSGDSVRIYITETITTPVKTPLERNESALEIASLSVRKNHARSERATPAHVEGKEKSETDNLIENYSQSIKVLRDLQAEYKIKLKKIAESRSIYNRASDADKEFMAEIILETESEAMSLKKQIDTASAEIRKAEAAFLSKGIIPKVSEPENDLFEPQQDKAQNNLPEYQFRSMNFGVIPDIVVETPKPEFDYTFRITKGVPGRFAEDPILPDGLVYQIQFMVTSSPVKVKDLRNMSPVYQTKQPSGKYLYTVGLFKTYAEASAALGKVKKNGFQQAFIIAYNNRKSLSTKQARIMENK